MNNTIMEISINNSVQWDDIVCSFSDYEVFYLSKYVMAFMEEDDKNGIPILLYYQNRSDRAINVVFKRDVAEDKRFEELINKGKYFDLSSPYGYGGFWGNISDYKALNQEYHSYCVNNHYICEFVRFDLFGEFYKYYDGKVESRTHNVIRSLEMPIDEIWMDFKQKVRKNVKKANRNGLKVVLDNTGKFLDDFLRIYYATMERSEAEAEYYFSRNFFEKLNEMKNNIMYFHVEYEDKIISTELVIYGAENAYSYLGGTDKDYFEVRPNDFLKYEIIKWAKEKGLKNFVLGGGYGTDDGIFQYKASLAPHGIEDFYIGKKIYNEELYKKLVGLCSEIKNKEYFPLYRG